MPEAEPDGDVTYEYVNIAVAPKSPSEAARDPVPRPRKVRTIKPIKLAPLVAGPGASLSEVEDEQIRKALAAVGGNKTHAARILGIERKTLYRKLHRMGMM